MRRGASVRILVREMGAMFKFELLGLEVDLRYRAKVLKCLFCAA
jgi:hypothetical protein